MRFCKTYEVLQEYMERQYQRQLPAIGFKELKKILENCRIDPHDTCGSCEEVFFPSLLKGITAVVECFNKRAKKLLKFHLASGVEKCFLWLKQKLQGAQMALIQEANDLITYAIINTLAMRKLLEKYDENCDPKQGEAFKSQTKKMHIEIMQSPWLLELMAFHLNMIGEETKVVGGDALKPPPHDHSVLFSHGLSLIFDADGKPSLSWELFDSVKIDVDLTCSICLDTVFDPVSLGCGHILCYMCACKAASVTIVDGLKAAHPNQKCPLCREAGVYKGVVPLEELHILLSRSCPEYWKERLEIEKVERIQQAKEHWESQCRAFMGV